MNCTELCLEVTLTHESCYCSYTSRSRNNVQEKRRSTLTDTGISKTLLKSQYGDFVFDSFGMQYTYTTRDLQLYQTASLVQWNDALRWTNIIFHPGMMHTLVSFLCCIGTLMKASGVDILISVAFAGINGKAWTNALRTYRLIIAVLLQNFYSNGRQDI